MLTVDSISVAAPLERVFSIAREIERWPAILPHYRWVRFQNGVRDATGGGIVEMAAWRPFGPLRFPTWWVSEMSIDRARWEIRYRHIRGITRGMQVVWRLAESNGAGRHVDIEVVHTWRGPSWPVIGSIAAGLVIGPVFVHGIAARTLAGIRRFAEETA